MTLEDFNTIISHDRLTLVDFYATWCGPCKATHKILDRLEETLNGTLDIIRIDIDHHENTDLVNHYRIIAQGIVALLVAAYESNKDAVALIIAKIKDSVTQQQDGFSAAQYIIEELEWRIEE